MDEQPEDEEEQKNLDACRRWTAGWPTLECDSQKFAFVMTKGQGKVLDNNEEWKKNKEALIPKIAQQAAALCVKWMEDYGRMHTDLHPGNVRELYACMHDRRR
jgi:hypothetical protein